MRPPGIVLSLLLCTLVPVGAAAQSNRCDSAQDMMENARRRLSVDATETVLQEGLQNLRRATDVSRSLVEKTRGDLATSAVQKDLRDALDRHAAALRDGASPSA